MLIYAAIYWSIILLIGIFYFVKSLKGIYEYILMLCRKYIITRILIALPLRLIVSIIGSFGLGIIIFIHGIFFACIFAFIYSIMGGHSKIVIEWVGYMCISLLFIPVIFMLINTLLDELHNFKQTT
jgi:hypothetical protein